MVYNPLSSAIKLITNTFAPPKTTSDGILVLTEANFQDVLQQHELLLIQFYKITCPRCVMFHAEFVKVAQLLHARNSQIKAAQVDCEVETGLISKYKITSFPNVKLFKNGSYLEYDGIKEAKPLFEWLKKNSS